MILRLLRRLLGRPRPKPAPRRKRGDRKGDEVLYPTDRYTEDIQPKK